MNDQIRKDRYHITDFIKKYTLDQLQELLEKNLPIVRYSLMVEYKMGNKTEYTNWSIHATIGTGRAKDVAIRSASKHGLKLVPWASIAIRQSSDSDLSEVDGRAFCFLPLPIWTGIYIL
jgi:hypothetical protein